MTESKLESSLGRVVGVVQINVGDQVYAIPIHVLSFAGDDAAKTAGGFFTSGTQCGIVVQEGTSARDMQAQVVRATEDAMRHLSRDQFN